MKNARALLSIIIIAILSISMIVEIYQIIPVKAANTPIPVYLKVYAEPNPVGVGQTEFLSLFFTKPLPIVGSSGGSTLYTNLTMNLVKPDGTNTTLGPYTSDTTGGVGGIEFTPTVAGNYTIQAFYPGQTISQASAGLYYDILPTMSPPDTFTVQQQPITNIPLNPLPTEYWSRPIEATNYGWAVLGGNWWGLGKPSFTDTGGYDATGNNFNNYTQAPNSGHIMWVKPVAFGGQPGLPITANQESQYTSTSILYRQFEPVILNGVIFYKLYPNTPTTTSSSFSPGLSAMDLRTGQQIWHLDTNEIICFGMVLNFHTIQEYGTQAFLVTGYNGTMWRLRDPLTGYVIANITDVPSTVASGLVETNPNNVQGSVYIYDTNTTGTVTTLRMWNSTRCLGGATSVIIRPSGNINYTTGYQWAVPIPTTITTNGVTTNISDTKNTLRNPALTIAARTPEGILLRAKGQALATFASEFGEQDEIECAISAQTGALLWAPTNRTLPKYHEVAVIAAGEGYYVEHDKDTNQATVFSITTGAQIGGVVQLNGNSLGTLERGGAIAYGKCYIWDFGGYVSGIDLSNATLAWTYTARDAGYATPYGIYPFWHFGSQTIADGKIFLSESRMYDPPLFAGAKKQAINVTDGSVVWSEMGFYGREPSVIADGYMVGYNSYDAQVYTWGKGPTDTTATVGQNVVQLGNSVLITGTVLDKSAGTTDIDRAARFPNGVAAVSDASQSAWMEYVYMQQPRPTNATGVQVSLYVTDANNNTRPIGTTTTDTNGLYSMAWTPDIAGKYTVYATFGGSESYWPSQSTTAFNVDPSATTTTAPVQNAPQSTADQYFVPAIAGIIVAIILGFALMSVLILRKRA